MNAQRTTNKPLTSNENNTLEALNVGPESVAGILRRTGGTFSYDATHSRLRRLEDRGYVRRIVIGRGSIASKWELTQTGRNAINA